MKEEKVYEGEVHDMKDMERNQREGRKERGEDFDRRGSGQIQKGAAPIWKALSVVIAMLALAYDVSPIDAVPDGIPVLGWLDDVGITLVAALNAYQQFAANQDALLVKLAKYVKWLLVALVLLAGVAIGGLITLIVHLVTQG
ncbi:YkvA family protein [Fibrobacter sp. UWEL]|uniref:YkvA family protein n=1 Tax=Fibrobacter sp. UWEL TaxID=1896209 RepID=UPI00091E2AAC|nr:YkvA family protein [Fibrobacter sp. UWEL]SHK75237.1 Protein of unknown function [Fibrobacter sp. UWEL]